MDAGALKQSVPVRVCRISRFEIGLAPDQHKVACLWVSSGGSSRPELLADQRGWTPDDVCLSLVPWVDYACLGTSGFDCALLSVYQRSLPGSSTSAVARANGVERACGTKPSGCQGLVSAIAALQTTFENADHSAGRLSCMITSWLVVDRSGD